MTPKEPTGDLEGRAHDPYCDLSRGLGGCNCLPDFGAPERVWIRHGMDVFTKSVPDADEYVLASAPPAPTVNEECCVTGGAACTSEDPCVCCAARSAAPALPNGTQNDILAWIDNDGNELADDAIVKLTSATGRAFSHVTAGWLKRFITATNGTRFGACPTCGRPHGEHTHNEQQACDHA